MNSQHMLIRNLWDEINTLHRSYLQTEECLKKIGEQTKLEDVIRQYLSLVPHLEKFFFPKISYVLQKSIKNRKDFSPFKAISAWSALAKYAHNIITQPWRKEFYSVQKYSGYFWHVVKEVLVDWETVFELMGYNTSRDIMVLQQPIDPDKITFVARDCFIAQVECQIMMKIYANVLKIYNDCTWLDILEFRENHTCSADQAIRDLCAIFLRRQQEDYVTESCVAPGPPYGYSSLAPYHSVPCVRYNDYKQSAPFGNSIVSIPSHPRIAHDKFEFGRYVPQDYRYHSCPKHIVENAMQLNDTSYQGNGYPIPFPIKPYCSYMYPNNAQFIGLDMDERDHCSNCHAYNYGSIYPYPYSNHKCPERSYDYQKRNKNLGKYDNSEKRHSVDNQRKAKDMCERVSKDTSSTYTPSRLKCTPVNVTDLEDAMKAFSYDFDKNNVDSSDQAERVETLSEREISPPKIEKGRPGPDLWECNTCTFHNSSTTSICELCGKSKSAGNEKIPLISGGRQCHSCTLVNERDATQCQACNNSLKDSPTYI